MRNLVPLVASLLLALPPSPGAVQHSRNEATRVQGGSHDELAVVVHRSNLTDDLSRTELRRMFLLETQTWPRWRRKVTVVLREKGQPDRAAALDLICQLTEAEYERHLLLQTFRGNVGWGPRSILSASAMLRFVFNVPSAIGHVWADESDDAVKVVRIDGRLPGEPGYPLRRTPRPRPDAAR